MQKLMTIYLVHYETHHEIQHGIQRVSEQVLEADVPLNDMEWCHINEEIAKLNWSLLALHWDKGGVCYVLRITSMSRIAWYCGSPQ